MGEACILGGNDPWLPDTLSTSAQATQSSPKFLQAPNQQDEQCSISMFIAALYLGSPSTVAGLATKR